MPLLLIALLWITQAAAEPHIMSWQELIPEGSQALDTSTLHIGADEEAPAANQVDAYAPANPLLNGKQIRIPGYVVPLGFNAQGQVSEFFLVPYYGACIHVPPPPANQIIYVKDATVTQEALWQPYWVAGELRTSSYQAELANASYQMIAQQIEAYELSEP